VLGLHAAFCAIVVRASLRVGSLPFAVRAARTAGWLCRTRASTGECNEAAAVASRRFAHATCLYRALTAYALLAHRYPDTQFHVGAVRARDVATHAWVTIGGRPIDAEACRYATLWTASD
jgi:hypothetical protein